MPKKRKIREEPGSDLMPRKHRHNVRAKQWPAGMKTADEVLGPEEPLTDPDSFEFTAGGPKQPTQPKRSMKDAIGECGSVDPLGLVTAVYAADGQGNMAYAATEEGAAHIDEQWFHDTIQSLYDRLSTGNEQPDDIVNDLAQRFAGFFEGSYEAYEFAKTALSARAASIPTPKTAAHAEVVSYQVHENTGRIRVLGESVKRVPPRPSKVVARRYWPARRD